MLVAALSMLAVVSTYIAFATWPGAHSNSAISQIVLDSVAVAEHAPPVTVGARASTPAHRAAHGGTTVATPRTRRPAEGGVLHATARSQPTGTTPRSAGGSKGGSGGSGGDQVQQVQKNVNDTTQQVTNQVQSGVKQVQDQVDQVVNQVIPPPNGNTNTSGNDVVQGVGDALGSTVTGVTTAVTGIAGSLLGG